MIDKEEKRKITYEEGASFASEKKIEFMECSCHLNKNVSEAFIKIIESCYMLYKKEKKK